MKKLAGLVLGAILVGSCGGILIGHSRIRQNANNIIEDYREDGWGMTNYIEDNQKELTITCYFHRTVHGLILFIMPISISQCLKVVITSNGTNVSDIDCDVPELKPQQKIVN